MAEAVANAAIEELLGQLITFSKEQIRLVRDFDNDFDNLKKSFDMVKAILHDAEEKQVTSTAARAWLKDLQDLDFEADNFFDDISYYQLRSSQVGPTRNKTVMETMMISVISFCCSWNDPTVQEGLQNRRELGGRIRNIKEKLESIHQEASKFGLQTVFSNSQPLVPAIPMETNSFTVDPVFLGRENDVSMIVKKLTTATRSPAEQVLSVLPIVGMGGLGKTTLARKVFHHEHIISHFGDKLRVWVHVPTKFDVPNILKKILTSLTDVKVEPETSEEALLKKLQQHVRTGRYLLVLDDIWDEERDKWEHLVNSLLGISYATGNCIIVTTRSQEVASIVQTHKKHELGCLSEDDCWSIIKAKAFINSGDDPAEFETLGRNIARRCCGLPLAAKVVGGLLLNKSKDEWQSIGMNKLSDFGDGQNTISKILKLSFDSLPSSLLKKCLLFYIPKICGIKLTSLTRLRINKIQGLECLPNWLFSNNHNLTKLEIISCPKMTHMVPRLGGDGAPSLLRELRIEYCRSLKELLPDDLHSLNCVERLYIWDCPNLKSFPIEMVESCAKSLEELGLMVIGCLHRMTRLKYLGIGSVPGYN